MLRLSPGIKISVTTKSGHCIFVLSTITIILSLMYIRCIYDVTFLQVANLYATYSATVNTCIRLSQKYLNINTCLLDK